MIRHLLDTLNENITLRLPMQLKSTLAYMSIANLQTINTELKSATYTKEVQLSYTKGKTSRSILLISFANSRVTRACFTFF